jgi:hypothetical protein
MTRSSRRPRTDRLTTVWMIAALVAAVFSVITKDVVPRTWWTTIHLVTLGVLTNGILQWSWYFARGILRLPPIDIRGGRDATRRSVAFNVTLVALVACMWTGVTWGVVTCAAVLGAIIAWHGFALARASRTALGSRFRIVIRFYVAAAALFVAGCAIAGALTVAILDPAAPDWLVDAHDSLALSHAIVMVCGWLGLSIAGTLVTLGPTVLRTKMDDAAAPSAVSALPWLCAAVVLAAGAVLAGWTLVAGIALGAYGVVLATWVGAPLARAAARRGPHEYPAWSIVAGVAWAGLGVVALAVSIARAPDAAAAQAATIQWLPVIGAGALAQIFIGALSYLLPVVVGGGPTPVRTGIATIETLATARLVVRNAALVALAVTIGIGSAARWAWWVLIIATFAVDVGLLAAAGVRQARSRRANRDDAFVPIGMPGLSITKDSDE